MNDIKPGDRVEYQETNGWRFNPHSGQAATVIELVDSRALVMFDDLHCEWVSSKRLAWVPSDDERQRMAGEIREENLGRMLEPIDSMIDWQEDGT